MNKTLELQKHLQEIACRVSEFQSRATRLEPLHNKELIDFIVEVNSLFALANNEIKILTHQE